MGDDASKIDGDDLELIERRLSEKIETDVRGRLFKSYLAMGAVVLAVLGYLGVNMASQAKRDVEKAFNDSILSGFQAKMDGINQKVAAVDAISDVVERAAINLQNVADSAKPQIATLETYGSQIDDLASKTKDLQSSQAVQDSANADELKKLSDQLSALADEVQKLATAVNSGLAAGTASAQTTQQIASSSGDIVRSAKDIQAVTAEARQKNTVFLQYDMPKDTAQAIAKGIADQGFLVPGIDFETSAAGLNEVRYYYDSDRPAAATLADAATRSLQSAIPGAPAVTIRSLTNWPNRKPTAGTLELWLGGPDTTAAAQSQ